MAALCLDASLETVLPLCYRGTHRLQWDLCRCFHEGSLQTAGCYDPFGKPCPPKQLKIYSPGGWGLDSRGPILSPDKGRKFPPQPLLRRLGFWAGNESCCKTHSRPLKRVMLSGFTTPCSTSSWYIRTPVSPLSWKNDDVSLPDGTPPTKPWRRKGDGIHAPKMHLKGRLSINLVFLVVILLFDREKFLFCEEDIFLPVLSVPLEETLCSCPSDLLQNRSKEVRSHV